MQIRPDYYLVNMSSSNPTDVGGGEAWTQAGLAAGLTGTELEMELRDVSWHHCVSACIALVVMFCFVFLYSNCVSMRLFVS